MATPPCEPMAELVSAPVGQCTRPVIPAVAILWLSGAKEEGWRRPAHHTVGKVDLLPCLEALEHPSVVWLMDVSATI